jgi:hypothetical protein
MKDLTWIDDVHWIEAFCSDTSGPLEKPFLVELGGKLWTVATDGCRVLALKGEQEGYDFKPPAPEDAKLAAVMTDLLHAPGEWRPVSAEGFRSFFQPSFTQVGWVGPALINRQPIIDAGVIGLLKLSTVAVSTDGELKPVRFRGKDWKLVIMPLMPSTDYDPPGLEIGEVAV